MKEIKAFIRSQKAEAVIDALEEAGVKGVTVVDVMGLGTLADPHQEKYSYEFVQKYSEVTKVEMVCSGERLHEIVEIIRKTAYTGLPGDGIIYVTPVEMVVKIRSGAVGEDAL